MQKDSKSPFRFSKSPNRAHEINWHEWGDEAFSLARRQDKPVILDISATWCHWCHVMDETTYSDTGVINILNKDYIAIRVDNDQHPEINRRYNQGGWPSTAFLTPGGDLITGSTYVAPAQMQAYLIQVRDFYLQHRRQIAEKIKEFEKKRNELAVASESAQGVLTEETVQAVSQIILSHFDQVHGGFGTEPKFPHPLSLVFALERGFETGDEHWKAVVEKTLPAMALGGTFDQVEGGFFRYSTTRDWSIPHFEKMLEDNSLLLDVYLQAFQVTGNVFYKEIATKVIHFLENKLLNDGIGAFGGSQEADDNYFHLSSVDRAKSSEPGVDPVIYTDWNAHAARAFFRAYKVLGDERYLQRASGIIEYLFDKCFSSETGMYHYWDGNPKLPGVLVDQVATIHALLDAYELTFNKQHLDRALALATIVRKDFEDHNGGFFDVSSSLAGESYGAVRDRGKFIDENAIAADAMLKLSRITGDLEYRATAERSLSLFTETFRDYELFSVSFGLAVGHLLHNPVQVTIIGNIADSLTKAFITESSRAYAPDKVVQVLDPVSDRKKIGELGYAAQPEPVAYLCLDEKCLPPITQPSEVEGLIKGWDQR